MTPRIIGGIVMCGVGGVWIAQGVGLLPGSYMTGRSEYAVLGAIVLIAGLALIGWSLRNRPNS